MIASILLVSLSSLAAVTLIAVAIELDLNQ